MPLYFAYGSCMSLKDLQRDVPESKYIGPAVLKNYQLGFTLWTEKRNGGVADIVSSSDSYVEGIVFDVPDFKGLDKREGHPNLYRRFTVEVFIEGKSQTLEVQTYEVVHKEKNDIPPSKEYAQVILDGAHNLSASYQNELLSRFKGII